MPQVWIVRSLRELRRRKCLPQGPRCHIGSLGVGQMKLPATDEDLEANRLVPCRIREV